MEFAVLFLIGYLIAQAGKENEQEAPPRLQEPCGSYHHSHGLVDPAGVFVWHTHTYDPHRAHWHPDVTAANPLLVYADETPNPHQPPIVIDSKDG